MNNNNFEPINVVLTKINEDIDPETPGFADNKIDIETVVKNKTLEPKIDIEEIKEKAFNMGYQKAINKFDLEQKNFQSSLIETNKSIKTAIDKLANEIDSDKNNLANILTKIVLTGAKKIFKNLLNKYEYEIIKNTITEGIKLVKQDVKIIIKINPVVYQDTKKMIDGIKHNTSFRGDIDLIKDQNIHKLDCVVEWQGGDFKNNFKQIMQEFDNFIEKQLN